VSTFVMAYDADCGLCTRFKQAVAILDVHRKASFLPLSVADELGLLDSVPIDRRHRSFHLVVSDKRVLSGTNALSKVVSLFPAGSALSRVIEGAPEGRRAMTFVYTMFVRLHEAGSCNHKPTPASVREDCQNPEKGLVRE